MKVKMQRTLKGAVGGLDIRIFKEGETYLVDGVEMDKSLSALWLRTGDAVNVTDTEEVTVEMNEKALDPIISNKAFTPKIKNKGKNNG